jgi:glycine/D-amino acid oxidase-like deaminating enzyme
MAQTITTANTRHQSRTIVVTGGGVAAFTIVQQLLDKIDSGDLNGRVVWLVYQFAHEGGGASESGGWIAVFCCDDPRAPQWAKTSVRWWHVFRHRHPELARFVEDTPTIVLSHLDVPPMPEGHPGRATAIDPSGLGFRQPYGIKTDTGLVVNTSAMLPAWKTSLLQHPELQLIRVPRPVAGPVQAADLAALYRADLTFVAIGLGAIVWGDREMEPRFGWLLRGPLAPGLPTSHTLMIDDDLERCVYSIPRRSGRPHSVYGGIVTHLDELADWKIARNEPETRREVMRIAKALAEEGWERAMDEIPLLKPALQDRTKLTLWASFRPYRPNVFAEQLDMSTTLGHPTFMLHGLGGSGWTITPAVAAELIERGLRQLGPDRELLGDWG